MFAVLGEAEIDPDRVEEAEQVLNAVLLPQVKEMDGFVSGTWTRDRDGSRGRSIVIFRDETSAVQAADAAASMAPPEGAPMKFKPPFDVVEVIVQT